MTEDWDRGMGDELCPHGRIPTAYCYPCEMEKILDLESDYGLEGKDWDDEPTLEDSVTAQINRGTYPASDKQIGGDHYKSMEIQPSEFIYRNDMNWCEGSAIKYICRHHLKGGLEDLEKAIHYIELLAEWKYNAKSVTKRGQSE